MAIGGPGRPIHVRLDSELDALLRREIEVTGWTMSQVVRYMLRRSMDSGSTPQEAGAKEGVMMALEVFQTSAGEMLTDLYRKVLDRL